MDSKVKKPENQLEWLARRNRLILDTMMNSFLLTDKELNIIDTNVAFCKMVGYSRDELLGMNVVQLDASMTVEEIKSNLKTVTLSGPIQFETKNRRKDGSVIDVEVSLSEMEIEGQTFFASFGRDITERKQAEMQLREKEKQLLSAAQIAKLAYWEYDVLRRLFTFNDQFYAILHTTPEKAGGYQMTAERYEELFVYPEDKQRVGAETVKAIKSADPNYSFRFEYRILLPNQEIGYVAVHYFIVKIDDGKTEKVFGTIQDITEYKRAEEALRTMEKEILNRKIQDQKIVTRVVINAQENERNRIGQELHDNVCQILTGAKLYLSKIGKKDSKVKELVEYPVKLISDSIHEIRFLSKENVTPLKDLSLKELIESLIHNLSTHTSIPVSFDCECGDQLISEDLKLNMYRIVQEQLNNILVHASPKRVDINMVIDKHSISVVVTDDGKGFDVVKKRNGIGISNMISRVESFNGEIDIQSSPGKGCTISINVPY